MTAERGAYRAITRVLLDGQDFQRFTPAARLVLIAMKVDFGPAGIEVHYPEALLWQLSHQTGYTTTECADALSELEDAKWIRREQNVVWIVDQLTYEPSLAVKNPKHRKTVQTHVGGLPTLAIVGAFVTHYREWVEGNDSLSKRYRKPIVSQKTETEDRRQKPKTDIPLADANGTLRTDSWPVRHADVWCAEVGPVKPGRIGAALKSAVDRHGAERVERAMRAYIAIQKADGKPCKLAWFAEQSQVWVERTATAIDAVGGEYSPTLDLLTRPSKGAA